jgi:cell division protein FtsL
MGRAATARATAPRPKAATARATAPRGKAAPAPTAAPHRAKAAPRTAAPRRAPARRAAAPRHATAPARRVSGHARPGIPWARPVTLPRGARVLDALLTGRIWIGLVGVLLAGIVFFNVDLLQMNREITQMADKAARIKRENDRLRHDYARLASSERIQEAAAALGLVYPAAGEVRYLESKPKLDAHNASKRIIAPSEQATPEPVAPTTTATTPPATTTTTTAPPE